MNESQTPRRFNLLKWAVVLSILIVLNLLFTYAIHLVYPQPEHEAFCPREQVVVVPDTKEKCVAGGGAWNEQTYYKDKPVPAPVEPGVPEVRGSCDIYYTCQKNFEVAHNLYRRNVFLLRVILGVLSLVGGFMVAQYEAVSLGLSYGGVLSLVVATTLYWSNLNEYLRVVVLALALAALIWLGVKKIKT